MFVTRAISFTNFFVATSALGFQVCVLYPWHKQLDADFEALKTEHLRVLSTIRDHQHDAGVDKTPAGLGIRARLGNLVGWTL
jgi:solute carrier family 25 phosphate transporter 3